MQGVQLNRAGLLSRVGALARRLSRSRVRREASLSGLGTRGRIARAGTGFEFHGYRAYLHGEDASAIDWTTQARLDRPFVKLLRPREERRLSVILDDSASMNTGNTGARASRHAGRSGNHEDGLSRTSNGPEKFQRAVEVALARALLALVAQSGAASGSGTQVRFSLTSERRKSVELSKPADWMALCEALQGWRAEGVQGLAHWHRTHQLAPGRVGREGTDRSQESICWVGDGFDLAPDQVRRFLGQKGARARAGRERECLLVQAPEERVAPRGSIRFVDPESGEQRNLEVGAEQSAAYANAFEAWWAHWKRSAQQSATRLRGLESSADFEEWFVD